ncbi:MAG: hypothetical protein QM704_25960 [Anaeromyxobacteraceae bacterium]
MLRGGRRPDAPARKPQARLRVLEGGEASDLAAALEETVQAARRMRREIEERIARSLEDPRKL